MKGIEDVDFSCVQGSNRVVGDKKSHLSVQVGADDYRGGGVIIL